MLKSYTKLRIFKIKILRLWNIGITNYGENVLDKNKHQLLSAIAILLNTLNVITLFIYIVLGFYWQLILVAAWSLFIHFMYINLSKNNSLLFSKFYGFQSVIIFIFCSSMIHGYQTVFNHFYLIFLSVVPFVFDIKEIKYQFILIIQAIALFIIQSLYGKTYLPNLNLLPNDKVETYTYLMVSIMITYIFGLSLLGVIINQYQENKLRKLKKKLFITQNKLRNQNSELQTFGMAATHSLKTPLFVINSFLNKIKENLQSDGTQQNMEYYIKLIKESNLLNEKYSDDLIKYTSIYNIENNYEKINLKNIINKTSPIILLNHKNAEIINDSSNDFIITANASLLEIIIQSLTDNGLKYNQSAEPKVRIYTTIKGHKASVYFQDNGIGISEEHKEKVFEPFNRINKIADVKGSGLGLSIAHLAALKMNSNLVLQASKQGSVFRLDLEI